MHNIPIFPDTPDSFRKRVQKAVQENIKTAANTTAENQPDLKNIWIILDKRKTEEDKMKHFMDMENDIMQADKPAKRKHAWQKKAVAAAIAIAVVGTGGFTAHAVVENLAKQRMESMPEEEKESLLEEVDSQEAEAATYSRKLTDAEAERKKELAIAYKNGQFPEGEILKVEDESQVDKDRLCYVPTTGYLYLPDRELTDEEILQILDNSNKRQYALKERTDKLLVDEQQAREEALQKLEEEVKANNGISREEAIAIAQKYLKELCGKTGEGMELCCYVTNADDFPTGSPQAGPDDKPFYVVIYDIDYVDQYISYTFHINSETGNPFYISFNDGYYFEGEVSVSEAEKNVQTMYQKAEEYLENTFGISEEYKEIYCSYDKNSAGDAVHMNNMGFWFVREDQTAYKIVFDCKNVKFAEFGMENYGSYLQGREDLRGCPVIEIGKTVSIKLK